MKKRNICLKRSRITEIPTSYRTSGSVKTMVTSDVWPEVEIWPFCACAMTNMQFGYYAHSSVMDLWTGLWGRYHVPQNVFLVIIIFLPSVSMFPREFKNWTLLLLLLLLLRRCVLTTSYTGWTFLSGCNSSCACNGLHRCHNKRHHATWLTAAFRHQTLLVGRICDPPTATNCLYRAIGRQAFSVAGPVTWNSLPDYLRDPTCPFDSCRDFRTFLFWFYYSNIALEALRYCDYALYKFAIDIDIVD